MTHSQGAGVAPTRNRPRTQVLLTVVERQQVSNHLVRLVVTAADPAPFHANPFTDKYAKLFFARPELGLTPPYDMDELRQRLDPADLPVTRTYTISSVAGDRLTIDFVVHGDEGLAGPWANAARPGDVLSCSHPGGAYSPDPQADWHLLIGDLSAVPAIDSALRALPDHATGLVFLEVPEADDLPEFTAPAGVRFTRLTGAAAGTEPNRLAAAVAEADWPAGRVQVFAHGERESMKAVRRLLKDKGVGREQLSLSGYWAYGRTEDRFQAEKREPIGQIPD